MKHKFSLIFVSIVLISVLLVGCNESSNLLKQVDTSLIRNIGFFNYTPKEDLLGNIYLINKNSKQYILFYQMNIDYKSIYSNIENSELEISIETKNGTIDIYLYEIVKSKSFKYSTIKVIANGKEIPFKSSIIN